LNLEQRLPLDERPDGDDTDDDDYGDDRAVDDEVLPVDERFMPASHH
jgi:hypothetical protein